jgi:hypothetical protein
VILRFAFITNGASPMQWDLSALSPGVIRPEYFSDEAIIIIIVT